MKIYSTRHGQTDYNKRDIILGTTDIELNETGLHQAEELAEKLKQVSGELGTTYETMEEVIDARKNARAEKNWEIADKIRIALDNAGIILKDSKEGTTWEIK